MAEVDARKASRNTPHAASRAVLTNVVCVVCIGCTFHAVPAGLAQTPEPWVPPFSKVFVAVAHMDVIMILPATTDHLYIIVEHQVVLSVPLQ